MADEPAGLPLADFIGALRAELRTAALAKDPQLQFNVGPVNVEFTLMTRHEGGGKGGDPFCGCRGRRFGERGRRVDAEGDARADPRYSLRRVLAGRRRGGRGASLRRALAGHTAQPQV